MDSTPPPAQPPYQQAPPPRKKGLGTGAIIGIGCGGIALLAVIGVIVAAVIAGPKLKKFADEAKTNPTRATATLMVSASGGALEMVAEDNENKRYTLKETASGTLTTIYWDEKEGAPKTIVGDFSAIPAVEAASPPIEAPENP